MPKIHSIPAQIITEEEAARELRRLRPFLESSDHNASPVEIDRLPVRPRLQADGDVGAQMGLPPATTDGIRNARNAILLSLQLALATTHDGIHYSRNRNDYTRLKHNNPDYWTYDNMRVAVNSLLARPDLVRENRARPQNPYAPNFTHRRSVLVAGPDFADALGGPEAVSEFVDPGERILLRDRRKKTQLIPPGPIVDETMRFLALFDDAVAGVHFSFSEPTIRWLSSSLAVGIDDGRKVLINTQRRYLTRIFTRTMADGGRLYRVFWQEVPKGIRSTLMIDGAPTAEYDYSACHLRLAYFAVGKRLEVPGAAGRDHYTLNGYGPEWRTVIKKSVSILLNARTYRGAVGAIASELREGSWVRRIDSAIAVVDAIVKRHDALAPLWHSGCGLGLQFIDSQLTVACATELIGRGIVPLPIHDSMLVRAEHLCALVEVMDRHFEENGPRLAAERFKGKALRKARGFRGQDLTLGRTASVVRGLSRGGVGAAASSCRADRVPSSPISRATPRGPDSAPSDEVLLTDLALLFLDPIIKDLERVVAHRKWVPGGMVRSALLTAMAHTPTRAAAANAVRAWIAQLVDATSATVDGARLDAEIARFVGRKQRPIAATAVARLSGVTSTMAAELGLVVVVPQPRRRSLSRRAKRMATTLPRIIDIKSAKPWGEARKRESWYAQHLDPADRQVSALSAILTSRDTGKIAAAKAAIERATRERASLANKELLPVDRLLARLQLFLLVRHIERPSASDHPVDVECLLGDQRTVFECKVGQWTAAEVRQFAAAFVAPLTGTVGADLDSVTHAKRRRPPQYHPDL